MSLVEGLFLGTFWLILAYLAFANGPSVVSLVGAGSGAFNSGVKTLQARG